MAGKERVRILFLFRMDNSSHTFYTSNYTDNRDINPAELISNNLLQNYYIWHKVHWNWNVAARRQSCTDKENGFDKPELFVLKPRISDECRWDAIWNCENRIERSEITLAFLKTRKQMPNEWKMIEFVSSYKIRFNLFPVIKKTNIYINVHTLT